MMRKKRCFILMPFSDEHNLNRFFYDTLKPYLEKSNYICERADISEGHNLDRRIIDGIYSADIIIADLTGQNCNVFYELGISHTIYKKTLMISQSLDSIPFDVNTYDVLKYNPKSFNKQEFIAKLKKILSTPYQHNLVIDHRPDIEKDILYNLNIKRLQKIYKGVPKIIFIDLDGTLFDSYEQRTRSSKKAFGKIFGGRTEEELNKIYESIYEDHEKYEKITGKNFRYDWLTKDIYRIAYLKEKGINPKDNLTYLKYCLDHIDSKTLGAIEDAYEVFMNEPFKPYPYAKQLLDVLKNLGFTLILVTEGAKKVQEWKLEQLGFDVFFQNSYIGVPYENLQKLREYLATKRNSGTVNMRNFDLIYDEYERMHNECKKNFHADTLRKVIMDFKEAFHLAVIGDRYDVDLKPYEEIDKTNILRIAVIKENGKYKQQTLDDVKKFKYSNKKTLKCVAGLSKALKLLVEPDTWVNLAPITSIKEKQKGSVDSKTKIDQIGEASKMILKEVGNDPFIEYAADIIKYMEKCD